jgi:hypothetical protein
VRHFGELAERGASGCAAADSHPDPHILTDRPALPSKQQKRIGTPEQ